MNFWKKTMGKFSTWLLALVFLPLVLLLWYIIALFSLRGFARVIKQTGENILNSEHPYYWGSKK